MPKTIRTTRPNWIDGGELYHDLTRRLIEAADHCAPDELPRGLEVILTIRQSVREMIQSMATHHPDEAKRLTDEHDQLMHKYFLELSDKEAEHLPGDMKATWLLINVVREKISANTHHGPWTTEIRPPQIPNDSERSGDVFKLMKGDLAKILEGFLEKFPKADRKNREWVSALRYGPFVELSKLHPEFTPEQLMDSEFLRAQCIAFMAAKYFSGMRSGSKPCAGALYAQVNLKFRDKPGSPWQKYKAKLQEESVTSGAAIK